MPYNIRLPDGAIVENIPDDIPQAEAKRRIVAKMPQYGSTDRDWGEAVTDVGASVAKGVGTLASLPGQLYTLATGDEDTASTRLGKGISDWAEDKKSQGLKTQQAKQNIALDAVKDKGVLEQAKVAMGSTLTSPTLLVNFLAEQVPQLLVPLGGAKVAKAAILAKGLGEKAAIAGATSAAIGTGAVQQGADVGADAYGDIYKYLIQKGSTPEAAKAEALGLARATGASASIISLLAQRLPGAKAIEERLAGKLGGMGKIKSAIGEGASEFVEEGGGEFSKNLAKRDVNPDQSLTQSVGVSGGLGAVGGLGMGAILGRSDPAPVAAPPAPAATPVAPPAPAKPKRSIEDYTYDELMRLKGALRQEEQTPAIKALSKRVSERAAQILPGLMTQDKREDALRANSMFADAQPDLFGEITAPKEAEETADPTTEVDNSAQLPLDLQSNETPVITAEVLDSLGVAKRAAIRKRITGKPQNDAAVIADLKKYADMGKSIPDEVRGKITDFAEQLQPTNEVTQNDPETTANQPEPILASGVDNGGTTGVTDANPQDSNGADGLGSTPAPAETPTGTLAGTEPSSVQSGAGSAPESAALEQATTPVLNSVPNAAPVAPPAPVASPVSNQPVDKNQVKRDGLTEELANLQADRQSLLGSKPPDTRAGKAAWQTQFNDVEAAIKIKQKALDKLTAKPATIAAPVAAPAPKGRPAKPQPIKVTADNTSTSNEEVDSALAIYNSAPKGTGILQTQQHNARLRDAIEFIAKVATDSSEPVAVRAHAKAIYDEHIDHKDVQRLGVDGELHNAVIAGASYAVEKSGTDTSLSESIETLIENGADSSTVLNHIASNSKAPFNRTLARLMLKLPVKAKLSINNATEGNLAFYSSSNHSITINRRGDSEYAFLHEMVHAASVYAIERGLPAGKYITKLYEEYVAKKGFTNAYGFKNAKEFLAEALTNEKFQRELEQIETSEKKNFFIAIVERIGKFIGISPKDNSAIAKLMRALPDVAAQNAPIAERVASGQEDYSGTINPAIVTPQMDQASAQINAYSAAGVPPNIIGRIKDFYSSGGLRGWRVRAVDSLAGFVAEMGTDVRRNGAINPVRLVRQALDAGRMVNAVMHYGTAIIDPNSGLTIAVPLQGERATPSWVELLRRMGDDAKRNGKTFAEYEKTITDVLYARRVHEMQRTGSTLNFQITPAAVQAGIAAYNSSPELQQLVADMDAIRHSLIDFNVRTGVLTPQMGQDFKDAAGYIPISRMTYVLEEMKAGRVGKGVASVRKFGEFTDSDRKMGSFVEAFSGVIDKLVTNGLHNHATSTSMQALETAGLAVVTNDPTYEQRHPNSIVRTNINGVPRMYATDNPDLIAAFVVLPKQVSSVIQFMQNFSRLVRAGVTMMPPFALKQVAEDVYRAFAQAGVDHPTELVGRILSNFPAIFFDKARGKENAGVAILKQTGAVGTYMAVDSSVTHNILQEAGVKKRTIVEAIYHYGEMLAESSDHAVRTGIYEQTMKETGDKLLAETRAREIINFSTRGSSNTIDMMARIVPFMNANIQGLDKVYTSATGNYNTTGATPVAMRKQFWGRMSTLFGAAMLYALMMGDDEDYRQLPDSVRNNNFIMPGWKAFYDEYGWVPSIPVPRELAAIFKVSADRIAHYAALQGKAEGVPIAEHMKYMFGNLVQTYSPTMSIAALKPIYENYTNYSFLLDRPLESANQQQLRPFLRYSNSTSEVAKTISKGMEDMGMGYSPAKIDNLVRGYFGSAAGVMLALSDQFMNPDKTERVASKSVLALMTAAPFMKDGLSSQPLTDLYELSQDSKEYYNTFEKMKKQYNMTGAESDYEAAVAFAEKNAGKIEIHKTVESLMKKEAKLREYQDMVNNNLSATPEQRAQDIKDIRELAAEFAKEVYEYKQYIRDVKAENAQ